MIEIIYRPESQRIADLRALVCGLALKEPEEGYNPLTATAFNELLAAELQAAFDEGRRFQRKYPDLTT